MNFTPNNDMINSTEATYTHANIYLITDNYTKTSTEAIKQNITESLSSMTSSWINMTADYEGIDMSGLWVYRLTLPVLVPLGLVFNTLTFLTMQRPGLKGLTTCVYLSYLSIADSCCLLIQVSRERNNSNYENSVKQII